MSHNYNVYSVHPARPVPDNHSSDVRMFPDRLEFDVLQGETWEVRAEGVSFCSMTCFGMDRPYVKLLMGGQKKIVSIDGRAVLDWCWSNRKAMLGRRHVDAWTYRGVPLPPSSGFEGQFASREEYDRTACLTCAGH